MSKLHKKRARKQQAIVEGLPPHQRGIKLAPYPTTPFGDRRGRAEVKLSIFECKK